jgi:hypothetical protein
MSLFITAVSAAILVVGAFFTLRIAVSIILAARWRANEAALNAHLRRVRLAGAKKA